MNGKSNIDDRESKHKEIKHKETGNKNNHYSYLLSLYYHILTSKLTQSSFVLYTE